MLVGTQFLINFQVQLAFLSVILLNFNFVGFSVSELLVFTFAWLLSDLAAEINMSESVAKHKKKLFICS